MLTPDCAPADIAGGVIRLLLGGVLLLSGVLKIGRAQGMEPVVRALGLPTRHALALGLPALVTVEVGVGAWLITGIQVAAALSIATALFVAFTVTMLRLVRASYKGGCACFGEGGGHQVGIVHIGRNIVLTLASTFALMRGMGGSCVGSAPWLLPPATLPLAFVLLLVGMLIYTLALEVEAALRAPVR